MSGRIHCWAAVVCFVLASWCGGAQEDKDSAEAEKKPTIYVGAGVVVKTKPYADTDAKVYPIPLFAYEGKRFYLQGSQGGYRLFSYKGFAVGPILRPRFDGYEQDDSPILHGMEDRHWSVDGGLGVQALTGVGLFSVSFVTDLLGRHRGQELEFGYTVLFKAVGFDFIPTAGLRYESENLVDYYYGVRANETRPGRPFYEPDAATDPFLRLAVRRKLSDHWSLLGAAQYEWLTAEITDSPLVDRNYEISVMAGALYAW